MGGVAAISWQLGFSRDSSRHTAHCSIMIHMHKIFRFLSLSEKENIPIKLFTWLRTKKYSCLHATVHTVISKHSLPLSFTLSGEVRTHSRVTSPLSLFFFRQAGRQTDGQAGRQTDRQTGGQTGGRADRQTDRQREINSGQDEALNSHKIRQCSPFLQGCAEVWTFLFLSQNLTAVNLSLPLNLGSLSSFRKVCVAQVFERGPSLYPYRRSTSTQWRLRTSHLPQRSACRSRGMTTSMHWSPTSMLSSLSVIRRRVSPPVSCLMGCCLFLQGPSRTCGRIVVVISFLSSASTEIQVKLWQWNSTPQRSDSTSSSRQLTVLFIASVNPVEMEHELAARHIFTSTKLLPF